MPGPSPRFDHDEARRLRAEGHTVASLALRYGVSQPAISRVTNPVTYAKMMARNLEWQKGGTCPQCGGQCSRNASREQGLCRKCASIKIMSATDELAHCFDCDSWLPHEAFSPRKQGYRPVRGVCRKCENARKAAWRKKNAAHERKAQAARKAVRRAVDSGKMIKPDTCSCGSSDRVQAHHEDYDQPLQVLWLCDGCHRELHRLRRAA